ncbi:hypothetical protein TRVA0_002S03136 [Trichomonascus vanleenenianus]|uniref:uncharacterized protein n=1 Tax=Trichomonascus vanleenenianus TaxID=2268995 RepID=UPI003ECA75C7
MGQQPSKPQHPTPFWDAQIKEFEESIVYNEIGLPIRVPFHSPPPKDTPIEKLEAELQRWKNSLAREKGICTRVRPGDFDYNFNQDWLIICQDEVEKFTRYVAEARGPPR